ncbi:MAG: phage head closure protein [Pseudomonadota bacterium]
MQAGRMREQVTLRQKSVTRDAMGGEVLTWSDFATVWAEAQPISGREFVALRAAQSEISIRFRMRYLAGVNTSMMVRWGGEDYDVLEAINVRGRDRELELLCRGAAGNV